MANGLFNLKQVVQAVQQGGWPNQKTPFVEYLVVAGGGGGGEGAGGAGGLLTGLDPVPNGQTLLVTIGGGGSYPSNGGNSVFGNITSTGGGRGGVETTGTPDGTGFPGGSGGGGAYGASQNNIGGQGTSGQGNAGGGNTPGAPYPSGGGGGAGTVGLKALGSVAGNGGAGIASSINGTVTTYAGGGGGGLYASGTVGAGGVGGGGNGGNAGVGSNGAPNTGGGAGGGAGASTGGSGIVIVSYPDVYAAATTVNATASTSGSGSLSLVYANQPSLKYPTTSAQTIGTGDFCIELFLYYGSQSSAAPYIATNSVGANSGAWDWYIQTNMQWYLGGVGIILNTSSVPTSNAWNHLVVCRTGTVISFFLNGTKTVTATDANNYSYTSATTFIGSTVNSTNWMVGNISNFRMTVGSSPYSALASTITVPTSPLTAITNTKLLLNTISGAPYADSSVSSLNTTSSITNAPPWSSSSPFTGTGYKNRVYTWTTSGTITF